MNCSNCGQVNDADAKFCKSCGAPLRRACANCGAVLKPDARFCTECGAATSGAEASDRLVPAAQPDRLATLQRSASPELQEKFRSAARQVEGERKPVTILFTDIVGSTSLAEKLDPEEWKEIVNGAHQRVSQAVYRYEGTIAQLLGDGVLAFFGAPITHEDDSLRAVLAAMDIQRAMNEYERQLQGVLDGFQMRVGLNSGMVVVGSVGSDLHMEYLAIGDAVNLAARLQSAARPGKVLISESTARLVQAVFALQPLGEITVKGRAAPVAVFEVMESRQKGSSRSETRRGFEMLRSPLVGRDADLQSLQQALAQLSAGLGQVVTITGEAGIGKSRLVEEARSAAPAGARWLEGRALSYGQMLSFWSIRQLLFDDLGLSAGEPEIKQRLALRKRTQALFGDDANQVLPYLANMLGVQLEDELAEKVKILDGETLKHQTLESITRYFTRLAQVQPTVLVFEDLHWADPSSLEALGRLLGLTDRVPILLLLLSRLEREHPSWEIKYKAERQFAHRYTGIELKPLPIDEQNRLVDNLVAVTNLPEMVRQRILERAEGNPLFLEEIVRHLVEQGAILHEGDEWRASGDIQAITIPETLRGVLLARIDRLQEDVRRTLQMASVIGKTFLYRLLEVIAEAESVLEGHLAQLQRADLVREKARLPELEYMFKHSLTQEAAYDSLLLKQRQEFHRQVGQALEELFAGRREEYLGLLAHHFDSAGDKEKAISYLIQAGDQARLSDEHIEAVGYYRRAIELLEQIGEAERRAQTWLKLGLVYHANFQFDAAYQAYELAFEFTRRTSLTDQAPSRPKGHVLRVCGQGFMHSTFDPGKVSDLDSQLVASWVFSGLAQVDNELNVIPDVARSWQVLDGGVRYIFHLRDDVRWTDGSPVTAHDFEWAWKRNLQPSADHITAQYLFNVVGAQAYHRGEDPNPTRVGIRALNDLTLEVRLAKPVAYFPYIVTMPHTYPLPRAVIELYGEDWWLPEHIVSNGAFRLVDVKPETSFVLERNPHYHGEFPGNIDRYEYWNVVDLPDRVRGYQEDRFDIVSTTPFFQVPAEILPAEHFRAPVLFSTSYLINPMQPPLDDERVRRALGFALNIEEIQRNIGLNYTQGGIIPPGMPGHSPDLVRRYDLELARRLLAEAGYPDGRGFPVLKVVWPFTMEKMSVDRVSKTLQEWGSNLGISLDLITGEKKDPEFSMIFVGWVADYPDPENFMRQSSLHHHLQRSGWKNEAFEGLLEKAAHLPDRSQRMALYRQADRFLVVDQAFVLVWSYSGNINHLIKSYVKNYHFNMLGHPSIRKAIIEEH